MSKEKQTVNGDVGNVVSGEVTIHNYSVEASPATQLPISLLQKRDLHRLMDGLVSLGESKRELWLMIHTKLNTKTVSEMTAADYHSAVEILQEYAQQIQNLKDRNILVGKIMILTEQAYRLDRDRYCLKHFGTTHLKGLDKEQLQLIFGYFDDLLNANDENKASSQAQETVSTLNETKSAVTKGRKPYVILGGVIILAAVVVGSVGFAGKWGTKPLVVSGFSIETNDKIISASVPALRSIFPGLNKYSNDFLSISSYKQKSGWHTIVLPISGNAFARGKYKLSKPKCYINIYPDGSYARILVDECQRFLLDEQDVPGKSHKFLLK